MIVSPEDERRLGLNYNGIILPNPASREIAYEGTRYVYSGLEEMTLFTHFLGRNIRESGRNITRIIPLANGGLTMSRVLLDSLRVPGDLLSPVRTKGYAGTNFTGEVRVDTGALDRMLLKEEDVIVLFDDVDDTGATLNAVIRELLAGGVNRENIITAVLCHKPHSSHTPDYFGFLVRSWVIFGHEPFEFMEEKYRIWTEMGLSRQEILERFIELQIPPYQVCEFFNG